MHRNSRSSSSPGCKITPQTVYKTSYSAVFLHSGGSPANFTPPPVTDTASDTAISSLSWLMSEHEEQLSRFALCLSNLKKTFKEAETLRQENTNLRVENNELSNQLELLLNSPFNDPLSTVHEAVRGQKRRDIGGEGFKSGSPTSVIENDRVLGGLNFEESRVTLPKSISVRSNKFWKMSESIGLQCGSTASDSGSVRGETRIQAPNRDSGPQRVYVRGEKCKKKGPIEMEVYNQGMFKTELCTKWQDSGTCPYGDHCQFAHSIGELRPVIRHPRYKTEVCRIVLSRGACPYGHRCHFRHALTEQEKLLFPLSHH